MTPAESIILLMEREDSALFLLIVLSFVKLSINCFTLSFHGFTLIIFIR